MLSSSVQYGVHAVHEVCMHTETMRLVVRHFPDRWATMSARYEYRYDRVGRGNWRFWKLRQLFIPPLTARIMRQHSYVGYGLPTHLVTPTLSSEHGAVGTDGDRAEGVGRVSDSSVTRGHTHKYLRHFRQCKKLSAYASVTSKLPSDSADTIADRSPFRRLGD